MKTGIDIVECKRFAKILKDSKFMDRVYTPYEQQHIDKVADKLPRMAGLYAAKEAVVKALGIGIGGGVLLNEIEVKHTTSGQPYISITPALKEQFDKLNVTNVEISISHTKTLATAIAILV